MNEKKEILIIDDTAEVIRSLISLLGEYRTFFAKSGERGIEMAIEKQPDLILLDIMMGGIDGYEACRRLQMNSKTKDIPIIFITAVSEAMDEAKGFEVGGVDYITKPFVPLVVQARIRNQLRLSESLRELRRLYKLALDANPITGLPGNNSIKKFIESSLVEKIPYMIIYGDLDNFKAFNDVYGFAHGDEVILYTAQLLEKVARSYCDTCSFVGHIGGDDFVIAIPSEFGKAFLEDFITQFDEGIEAFYSREDLKRGTIKTEDRKGVTQEYPVISISLSGVDLTIRTFSSYLAIIDVCADLKHQVKSMPGSAYLIDRRRDEQEE